MTRFALISVAVPSAPRARAVRAFALAAALLLGPAAALAADPTRELSLEDLLETPVSAASKYAQSPAEAPSMVSSVSAREIRAHGWRTLAQALGALRGVHTSYDRSYTYLGIRGFARPGDYNNRILLLIDGVPINDGVYDQAMIGSEFPLDLALIERIEYVPGAGSVMYGGNALFGVVNVVTAAGAQRGREVEIGAGRGDAWTARFTAGKRDEEGRDWLVSATRERRRGDDIYFDSYATPNGNAWSHGLDHEANDRLFGRYNHGELTLSALYHSRTKGYPGGPYSTDLDGPASRQSDRRFLFSAALDRHLDVAWRLGTRFYYGDYAYAARYSTSGALESESAYNSYLGTDINLIGTAWRGHTTVFGLSWRNDFRRQQITPGINLNTPRRNLGLYIQDDWALHERLTLSLGLRHDRDNANCQHLSPRLAAILRPDDLTTVKLIAGKAYRDPNAYETEYAYPNSSQANPALGGERLRSEEIGVERALGVARLSASLYRNRVENMIAIGTDSATNLQVHRNVGAATARGLELEARAAWGEVMLRGSVAWQRVRHESGAALANAPVRLAKFLVSFPLPGKLRLGWETHHIGTRTTDSGNIRSDGSQVGGHTVSHLALGGPLGRELDWQLRLNNVFDRRYGDVVGAEFDNAFPGTMSSRMPTMIQDGRALSGHLLWKF